MHVDDEHQPFEIVNGVLRARLTMHNNSLCLRMSFAKELNSLLCSRLQIMIWISKRNPLITSPSLAMIRSITIRSVKILRYRLVI